jgi:DNA-directed RNA polymerase subunit H (RpoH/RPB5)
MDPGSAGGIPTPKTPEEAAALQQLLQELGISPEDLAKLQQADVKVAAEHAFAFKARQAILGKVAALRIVASTTNINKVK